MALLGLCCSPPRVRQELTAWADPGAWYEMQNKKALYSPSNRTNFVFQSIAKKSLLLLFIFFLGIVKCITNYSPFSLVCLHWETLSVPSRATRWQWVQADWSSLWAHLFAICPLFSSSPGAGSHCASGHGPSAAGWNYMAVWVFLLSPSSLRCQANSKVRTHIFMKQKGV